MTFYLVIPTVASESKKVRLVCSALRISLGCEHKVAFFMGGIAPYYYDCPEGSAARLARILYLLVSSALRIFRRIVHLPQFLRRETRHKRSDFEYSLAIKSGQSNSFVRFDKSLWCTRSRDDSQCGLPVDPR